MSGATADPWTAEPATAPDFNEADQGRPEPRRSDESRVLEVKPLPADCPVVPLGLLGKEYYFLDVLGQLLALGTKFDAGDLTALFGAQIGFLDEHYTQWGRGEPPKPNGFNQVKARRALINACQKLGIFNPVGRVHGLGSHRGDHGELILHCGDTIYVSGQKAIDGKKVLPPRPKKPGRVGKLLFPLKETILHPAEAKKAATRAEMWSLLCEHFDSWLWASPHRITLEGKSVNIFAWMTFGWVMMAKLCGAVAARAPLWITGPSGAGKSVLHVSLGQIMGEGWALQAKNMTEAYVTQTLQQDRLAVLFDEAERSEQNKDYLANILTLAKLAFDGSKKGRGSSDGKATTTQIFAAMQFSSVLLPPLKPEERNRMVIVEINPFPDGTIHHPHPLLPTIAPRAQSLLLHAWPRFDATLAAYVQAMAARNWNGREQTTYATVLACGDLALFDDVPDAMTGRVPQIVAAIEPMLVRSRNDVEDHPELCIGHLGSSLLPSSGGKPQESVAQWIIRAVADMVDSCSPSPVERNLQSHGMRLVNLVEGHEAGNGQGGMKPLFRIEEHGLPLGFLAVAGKTNAGMLQIFRNSPLFADGAWMQALQRLELKSEGPNGPMVRKAYGNKRARFGSGPATTCVLIPLEAIVGLKDMRAAIRAKKIELNVPAPDFASDGGDDWDG